MGNGRRYAQRSSPVTALISNADSVLGDVVQLSDSLPIKSVRRSRKVSDSNCVQQVSRDQFAHNGARSVGSSRGKIQARCCDRVEAAKHIHNVSKAPLKQESSDSDDSGVVADATKKSAKKTKSSKATGPIPTEAEVLEAVASLYGDELKPYGRILRKRLAERATAAGATEVGEPDLASLRAACIASSWVTVESEDGGEWSALLVGNHSKFVDVYNPVDCYSESLWAAATNYFQNLTGDEAVLPGGRYSCALTLAERRLPFLEGHSLGQLSHIVQLAISQRKCLGYLNGGITPYSFSHSKVKDSAAAQQSSCAQAACASDLTVASWDTARMYLRTILGETLKAGSDSVPLSNIKRIFRSQFNTELSETSLGHSKLSELLQDSRLDDICTVRLLDQGYFVIPQFSPAETTSTIASASRWSDMPYTPSLMDMANQSFSFAQTDRIMFSLDEPLRLDEVSSEGSIDRLFFCADEPLCLEEAAPPAAPATARWFALSPSTLSKTGSVGSMVQNTFIHAAEAPVTPLPGAAKRSRSLPKNLGSARSDWEASCHALSFMAQPVDSEKGIHEGLALIVPASPTALVPPSPAFPSPALTASPLWTPQRSLLYPPTPEMGLLCVPEDCPFSWSNSWSNVADNSFTSSDEYAEYRPVFCADEPLCLELAETSDATTKLTQGGYVVHDTFIKQPLTPAAGASQKRSSSLPRNLAPAEFFCKTGNYSAEVCPCSPALTASPWTPHGRGPLHAPLLDMARGPLHAPLLELSRPVLRLSEFV